MTTEWRFEAAERATASAQIELGRRAREIADRQIEIAVKSAEIAQQLREIRDLNRALRERDVEIAAREIALLDLTHQRDTAVSELADARSCLDDQQMSLERRKEEVAPLEARISELSRAMTARERAFESTALESTACLNRLTDKLVTRQAVASRLESQVLELEALNIALRTESELRAAEAVQLRQRLSDLEPRLSENESLRDDLSVANGRQTPRTTERQAELFRMKTSHREEVERYQDRISGAVARENELTMRVRALIATRVEAESAMRARSRNS